jgi:hypothetical protein
MISMACMRHDGLLLIVVVLVVRAHLSMTQECSIVESVDVLCHYGACNIHQMLLLHSFSPATSQRHDFRRSIAWHTDVV